MKVIFATTNNRKLEDLNNVIAEQGLDLEVVSLSDIGWDRGEIEENGTTIQENSLIKANAVLDFCKENNIDYPIITDDAGLFVDALNGQPGIYTARYAEEELKNNTELPKHYALYKLLNNLESKENRKAEYRCAVTIMLKSGKYYQFTERTEGYIAEQINEPIKKPYFYSLFVEKQTNIPFNQLSVEQLKETYRFKALRTGLKFLDNQIKQDSEWI